MYTMITLYTKGFVVETGTPKSLTAEFERRKSADDVLVVYLYDSDGDVDSIHVV